MFFYEFKLLQETENGKKKPVDIRLLDWQLCKNGSPICDLSYCLYSGGSKEVFDNLTEYLKVYYKSFSDFVRELGSEPEKLLPFEKLQQDWKKYSKLGLMMAIAIWRMKMTDTEDLLDFTDFDGMDNVDGYNNIKVNEEKFEERVRDILEHMNEIGAL